MRAPRTHPDVVALLERRAHPLRSVVDAVRRAVLAASPRVQEVVKWNSPSFCAPDDFATLNLHADDTVRLVLHTGARGESGSKKAAVADPHGLIKWLGPARGLITFQSLAEVRRRQAALKAIIRGWI